MARLVLKFRSQVLREIPIGAGPVTIGRASDNDVHIDDPAVSDHHARLFTQGDKMAIEDLGSLNGTLVNDARVNRATLRDGDNIQIGEYLLQLDTVHEASTTVADAVSAGRKTPLQDAEDSALETGAGEPLHDNAIAADDELPVPAFDLSHLPTLRVLRGRTDQREYILAGKLTVIGTSPMASVKMLGWFAPEVGGQINHQESGYFLGMGDIIPKINGQAIQGSTILRDGDVIQIGRVRLKFSQPD